MNEKQQNEDRKNQFEGTRRREHELANEANLQLPDWEVARGPLRSLAVIWTHYPTLKLKMICSKS